MLKKNAKVQFNSNLGRYMWLNFIKNVTVAIYYYLSRETQVAFFVVIWM